MKEFFKNVAGVAAVALLAYCVGSMLALAWYLVLLVISA